MNLIIGKPIEKEILMNQSKNLTNFTMATPIEKELKRVLNNQP